MTTKTNQLRDIVAASVAAGWKPHKEGKGAVYFNSIKENLGYPKKLQAVVTQNIDQPKVCRGMRYFYFTIYDLIADSDFMKVFGDDLVCPKCGGLMSKDGIGDINWCYNDLCSKKGWGIATKCYLYHARKAFDLLLDGGDAVGYLHDKLKEGK